MRIKTSELEGAALDWAAAKAVGLSVTREINGGYQVEDGTICLGWIGQGYSPSTNWLQGGPLIEQHRTELSWSAADQAWRAEVWIDHQDGTATYGIHRGPTPLVAAMRAIVASKLGEEVEVPEETKPD